MQKIIKYLRSESFIFTAIICVLFSQILHTAYLFKRVSRFDMAIQVGEYHFQGLGWVHALLCATAIEAAIRMFIINGKSRAAQIYAFASFAGNLLYYQHWHDSIEQLVASTLISAMLSGSIWYFSDLFVEKLTFAEKLEETVQKNAEAVSTSNSKLFTCPECHKTYETEQQLRGHLSGHARRDKKKAEKEAESTPAVTYSTLGIFEGVQ